jgi:sigma-E factor negative regulatory protein RseB
MSAWLVPNRPGSKPSLMCFMLFRSEWVRSVVHSVLPVLLLAGGMAVRSEPVEPSATEALNWLTGMRQAVSHLNYKGVVAYLKDKQVESFQLFHSVAGGIEQERLVSMNSPLREVVRSADKVTCYYPDAKTAFVENKPSKHSLLMELPEDLSRLSRYYQLRLDSQEYVARRLSQSIHIIPRDDFRYARRLWIDVDSKLPLKFELMDDQGQVIEQMVFTSLEVEESIPVHDLDASTQVDALTWQVGQREILPPSSLNWSMENVPDGFQMISYTRLKRVNAEKPVDHILLSDGVSSVSIYVNEIKKDAVKAHPKRIGAINAYSRKIDHYRVTVMGEVPVKTVQTIADGLRYQDKQNHD